tara:strand:+ start:102 stop:293 length:192 start_codon:yes stop_codon:yes gene_type:complete
MIVMVIMTLFVDITTTHHFHMTKTQTVFLGSWGVTKVSLKRVTLVGAVAVVVPVVAVMDVLKT